jgi:tRNA1(Val) A37 N6-methylase TrmN6
LEVQISGKTFFDEKETMAAKIQELEARLETAEKEEPNSHFAKPVLCAGAVSKDGISLIHGDSLQALKSYGDNYFDVAIVDPPYGLGDRLVKGGAKGGMGTMRNLADER